MASVDGQNYYGWQFAGASDDWEETALDLANVPTLGNLCGRSQVWVALVFKSDVNTGDQGVFVDDLVIRKRTGRGPAPERTTGGRSTWQPAALVAP
jgi:hypothetical protein